VRFNLVLPSRKLMSKVRDGGRCARKRYDTARTPLERLEEFDVVEPLRQCELKATRRDPDPLAVKCEFDARLQRCTSPAATHDVAALMAPLATFHA